MFGNTLLILPFGLLPIAFFIGYIIFIKSDEANQKYIAGNLKSGNTEFPALLTDLLGCGCSLRFTNDGHNIIVSIPYYDFSPINCADEFLAQIKSYRKNCLSNSLNWLDQCQISDIRRVKRMETKQFSNNEFRKVESEFTEAELFLPKQVISTIEYITGEIEDLGRTLITDGGARKRLNYVYGTREVEFKEGKYYVRISREQESSGIFSSKNTTMSEKQITRNIKNRLWNKATISGASVDAQYYYGFVQI